MSIRRKEGDGTFPKRIKLGANRVGWILSEILEWVEERKSERSAGEIFERAEKTRLRMSAGIGSALCVVRITPLVRWGVNKPAKSKNKGAITMANDSDKKANSTNPFDPANLRISQDYAAMADVKRILTKVPVGKPNRRDFVRTNPNPEFQITTTILEFKEDREIYLVAPELRTELFGEVVPVTLFTGINRQGVIFLWPVKLPGDTGRANSWHESAMDAAIRARTNWIRMAANMNLGAYEVYEARGDLPEPDWPEETLEDLLGIAFKGHYVDDIDHPVMKRLRGEM